MMKSMLEWKNKRTGKITSTLAESGAFFHTEENLVAPDAQFVFVPGIVDNHARTLNLGYGFSCHLTVLRPDSIGEVRLNSNNLEDSLAIDPKFFDNDKDMALMIRGAKFMQKVLEGEPLASVRQNMLCPVEKIMTSNLNKIFVIELIPNITQLVLVKWGVPVMLWRLLVPN